MEKEGKSEGKKPIVALSKLHDWLIAEKRTGETAPELAELRQYWKDVGVFSIVEIGPDNYRMVFDAYFDEQGRLGVDPVFEPPPA